MIPNVDGTVEIYKSFERHATMYVCISIIGCKGYRNYSGYASMHSEPRIDRDRILCAPIEIGDILKAENVEDMVEECKKMTRYALGSDSNNIAELSVENNSKKMPCSVDNLNEYNQKRVQLYTVTKDIKAVNL